MLKPKKSRQSRQKMAAVATAWTLFAAACCGLTVPVRADGPATLDIDAGRPGPAVSPTLYGLMTEEINFSYDGGLYAELVRNRSFQDDPSAPAHWSLVQDGGGAGTMALDTDQPLSAALPVSLKVAVTAASRGRRVGAANEGYWGVPVRPDTPYQASFYARGDGKTGPLTVSLESADGTTIYAKASAPAPGAGWKQQKVMLRTGRAAPALGRLVITASRPGTVWLNLVSLFPPTYNGRPNGNRVDLMETLAAMKPAFLRLPGGNYLEGNTIEERFDWKKTLGPLTERPGHRGPWGYRSSDGTGLLEFLTWCEDLKMEPVLAVYAGYSLRGQHIDPGPALAPYVQDALDEIEYVTGGPETTWGRRRAADGHPRPFPLRYVEIGNEDNFDRSHSYDGRFAQFLDAIKAKHPRLQCIATMPVQSRTPDLLDEHFYRSAQTMAGDAHHYDSYPRSGPKIFVGEWASQDVERPWVRPETKGPTPTLNSALGDAAWMTGMERNSDIVVLESYAPLLVNVNPGGRQWAVNLIGYDALRSYGSPSYWAQVMFSRFHGDVVLPATLTGGTGLYESVTRDAHAGMVYVKLVNTSPAPQAVRVTLSGVKSVADRGTTYVLSGSGPQDTNTITDPSHIVPQMQRIHGLSPDFRHTLPAYSVTVLVLTAG